MRCLRFTLVGSSVTFTLRCVVLVTIVYLPLPRLLIHVLFAQFLQLVPPSVILVELTDWLCIVTLWAVPVCLIIELWLFGHQSYFFLDSANSSGAFSVPRYSSN